MNIYPVLENNYIFIYMGKSEKIYKMLITDFLD